MFQNDQTHFKILQEMLTVLGYYLRVTSGAMLLFSKIWTEAKLKSDEILYRKYTSER